MGLKSITLATLTAVNLLGSPYVKDIIEPHIGWLEIKPKYAKINETVIVKVEATDNQNLKYIEASTKREDDYYRKLEYGAIDSLNSSFDRQIKGWMISFQERGIYKLRIRAFDADNNWTQKIETIYVSSN